MHIIHNWSTSWARGISCQCPPAEPSPEDPSNLKTRKSLTKSIARKQLDDLISRNASKVPLKIVWCDMRPQFLSDEFKNAFISTTRVQIGFNVDYGFHRFFRNCHPLLIIVSAPQSHFYHLELAFESSVKSGFICISEYDALLSWKPNVHKGCFVTMEDINSSVN